jgi:hypothetical protein
MWKTCSALFYHLYKYEKVKFISEDFFLFFFFLRYKPSSFTGAKKYWLKVRSERENIHFILCIGTATIEQILPQNLLIHLHELPSLCVIPLIELILLIIIVILFYLFFCMHVLQENPCNKLESRLVDQPIRTLSNTYEKRGKKQVEKCY